MAIGLLVILAATGLVSAATDVLTITDASYDEHMKNNETVVNYFLHLQTFVSDISKYFDGKDSKFRKYIDDKMNRLVRDALDYKLERFEYDSKSSVSSTNEINSVQQGRTGFISSCAVTDVRHRAKRIKCSYEHK